MNSNVIAALLVRLIEAGPGWLRKRPPHQRELIYLIAGIAAVIVFLLTLAAVLFVPSALAVLKALWIWGGPVVLLVVATLAKTHLNVSAVDEPGDDEPDDVEPLVHINSPVELSH